MQKRDASSTGGCNPGGLIIERGHEDDRQRRSRNAEALLKLEAGHAALALTDRDGLFELTRLVNAEIDITATADGYWVSHLRATSGVPLVIDLGWWDWW